MFDPLPENVLSAERGEARGRALRRSWRYFRLLARAALIVLGAIALVVGVALLASLFLARPRGPAVRVLPGTVVGIQMRRAISDGYPVYAPIVRFQADARRHEFTSRMFTNPSRWQVGQAVEVLYDPASDRMVIAGLAEWRPALEFTLFGAGSLVVGCALWRSNPSLRPGPAPAPIQRGRRR
jgi:uncharacterized protein DUF3592